MPNEVTALVIAIVSATFIAVAAGTRLLGGPFEPVRRMLCRSSGSDPGSGARGSANSRAVVRSRVRRG